MRPLSVDELEQWVAFGARWRPVRIESEHAVIDLCQCTGELVERRESTDPEVIEYLRAHEGDE